MKSHSCFNSLCRLFVSRFLEPAASEGLGEFPASSSRIGEFVRLVVFLGLARAEK